MKELQGKTAVISGAAEGIGLGVAKAMGRHGMNIVLADINVQQLEQAERELQEEGIEVLAVALDAADLGQWQNLAERSIERFGKVHMLVNNAGVSGTPGPVDESDNKDWRWVIDVNLMGVVYGTQTMIPLIKRHGEGGWLINVASMAGFGGLPMAGPYNATKAAVVGMSESWQAELLPHNINVSVLCPGFVKTRINHSKRNKQTQYQAGGEPDSGADSGEISAMAEYMQSVIDAGLPPEVVGERVVEAIAAQELYIFTHPGFRPAVQKRFAAIDAAFERAQASPLLVSVLNEKIPQFG
jgi:NAD(P)-dependent dehydrogenase (short-subunit alcohol dehydrogenase family)